MVGTLNIQAETALHDFEKQGYCYNIHLGAPLAPDNNLLPFWFIHRSGSTPTCTSFKLQRVDISLTILDEYSLNTAFITSAYEDSILHYYYNAEFDILAYIENTLKDTYTDGYYRYEITLSDGTVYYSEIFRVTEYSSTGVIGAGDFNVDFGSDFDVFGG